VGRWFGSFLSARLWGSPLSRSVLALHLRYAQ
jgi:hypothetical protein